MARSNIYFTGINIKKGDDGCKRTLNQMKEIYTRCGGKSFNIQEINLHLDPDLDFDDIPTDFMENFEETLAQTIRREFPLEDFA